MITVRLKWNQQIGGSFSAHDSQGLDSINYVQQRYKSTAVHSGRHLLLRIAVIERLALTCITFVASRWTRHTGTGRWPTTAAQVLSRITYKREAGSADESSWKRVAHLYKSKVIEYAVFVHCTILNIGVWHLTTSESARCYQETHLSMDETISENPTGSEASLHKTKIVLRHVLLTTVGKTLTLVPFKF